MNRVDSQRDLDSHNSFSILRGNLGTCAEGFRAFKDRYGSEPGRQFAVNVVFDHELEAAVHNLQSHPRAAGLCMSMNIAESLSGHLKNFCSEAVVNCEAVGPIEHLDMNSGTTLKLVREAADGIHERCRLEMGLLQIADVSAEFVDAVPSHCHQLLEHVDSFI